MNMASLDHNNLVSLCQFRERTPEPGRVDRRGSDNDPALWAMLDSVDRELQADGLLVLWHEEDQEPRFLFASGACQHQSDSERDMITAAQVAISAGEPTVPPRWGPADLTAKSSILTTRIAAGAGTAVIVSIYRRAGDALRLRTNEASSRLLPMVNAFFQIWTEREGVASRLRGMTAVVNHSGVGSILVDGHGHIVFASAAADALIDRKDGLRRTGRMLSATRLPDTLRLHAAIEHVVNIADDERAGLLAPVVSIHRNARRPLLAAISPVDPSPSGSDVAAIVTLHDPDQPMDVMLVPACKMYGLSPVETRLACLLANGAALIDAAATMRLQEQTARSYLKQLFLKTDTNRQGELVWLLLKSAVRLDPGIKTNFVRPPQMG